MHYNNCFNHSFFLLTYFEANRNESHQSYYINKFGFMKKEVAFILANKLIFQKNFRNSIFARKKIFEKINN